MLGSGHHYLTEEETLMVHPRATLTPRGRLLLVRRVDELGWPAARWPMAWHRSGHRV
jgi:hypothetical protein